jgi:hypothetical protein
MISNPTRGPMRGAGGTPGGLGTFLAGSAMVVAGGYLLLTRVTVSSGLWMLWGYNAFGLPTSLFDTLLILGLLAGGLGLVARSLRAQGSGGADSYPAGRVTP